MSESKSKNKEGISRSIEAALKARSPFHFEADGRFDSEDSQVKLVLDPKKLFGNKSVVSLSSNDDTFDVNVLLQVLAQMVKREAIVKKAGDSCLLFEICGEFDWRKSIGLLKSAIERFVDDRQPESVTTAYSPSLSKQTFVSVDINLISWHDAKVQNTERNRKNEGSASLTLPSIETYGLESVLGLEEIKSQAVAAVAGSVSESQVEAFCEFMDARSRFDTLPVLRNHFQSWLDSQFGATFSSFQEMKSFVQVVNGIAEAIGCQLTCPKCGQRATLVAQEHPSRNPGEISFYHRIDNETKRHSKKETVPRIPVNPVNFPKIKQTT